MTNVALKTFFFAQVALEHVSQRITERVDNVVKDRFTDPLRNFVAKFITDNDEVIDLRRDVEIMRQELHALRKDMREMQKISV